MKILNGTDIVEIERIEDNIKKHGEKFLNKIYTPKEIEYCENKKANKYESYAARFAAKEAVFKALDLDSREKISWKEIEIINKNNGKPEIKLSKKIDNLDYIEISLSHSKLYAVAYAIAIFKEK